MGILPICACGTLLMALYKVGVFSFLGSFLARGQGQGSTPAPEFDLQKVLDIFEEMKKHQAEIEEKKKRLEDVLKTVKGG